MRKVRIGHRLVGEGEPCYFIAEIAGNFSNFAEGRRLVDAAAKAGADAVKFQTFEAETVTTKKNMFDMESIGKVSQYELFKKHEPDKDLQREIYYYAMKKGITAFSAPSHERDLDLLQELDIPV